MKVMPTLIHNLSKTPLFFNCAGSHLVLSRGFVGFILRSSDDSMTWPGPVLSLLL